MMKTRNISLAAAVLAACLAWAVLPHAPAVGNASGGMDRGGGPAGQTPFAGTYLAEMDVPFLWQGIVQLHTDGTVWAIDQNDCGLAGQSNLNSPNMGAWKRTGPRQITAVTVFFSYDNPHVTYPTEAVRMTSVADFDHGFDTGWCLANQRLYDLSLGEDPLDPDQGTLIGEVNMALRRIVP